MSRQHEDGQIISGRSRIIVGGREFPVDQVRMSIKLDPVDITGDFWTGSMPETKISVTTQVVDESWAKELFDYIAPPATKGCYPTYHRMQLSVSTEQGEFGPQEDRHTLLPLGAFLRHLRDIVVWEFRKAADMTEPWTRDTFIFYDVQLEQQVHEPALHFRWDDRPMRRWPQRLRMRAARAMVQREEG